MATKALRSLRRPLYSSLCRSLSPMSSSSPAGLSSRVLSSSSRTVRPRGTLHPMRVQLRLFSSGGEGESGALISEKMFHSVANDTLDMLQEKIEAYGEDLDVDGFDMDYSDGVMTVRLGDLGTYVLNKQTPNRQIWLSSPVSGPARFDWMANDSMWVYRRSKAELVSLLEQELSELLGSPVSLKN